MKITLKMRFLLEDSQTNPPLKCIDQTRTITAAITPSTCVTYENGTAFNSILPICFSFCSCFVWCFILFGTCVCISSLRRSMYVCVCNKMGWIPDNVSQEQYITCLLLVLTILLGDYVTWHVMIGDICAHVPSVSCLILSRSDLTIRQERYTITLFTSTIFKAPCYIWPLYNLKNIYTF